MDGACRPISTTPILEIGHSRQQVEETSSVTDIQSLWLVLAKKLEDYEDTVDLYHASTEIMEFDENKASEATLWLKEKMELYQGSLNKITCIFIINSRLKIIPNFFFERLPSLSVMLLENCDCIEKLPPSFSNLQTENILMTSDCRAFDNSLYSFGPAAPVTKGGKSDIEDFEDNKKAPLTLQEIDPIVHEMAITLLHNTYTISSTPLNQRVTFSVLSEHEQDDYIARAIVILDSQEDSE